MYFGWREHLHAAQIPALGSTDAIWTNLARPRSEDPHVLALNKGRKWLHSLRKAGGLSERFRDFGKSMPRIGGTYQPEDQACIEWEGHKIATLDANTQVVWVEPARLDHVFKELFAANSRVTNTAYDAQVFLQQWAVF